jgi:CRP-like cAMP-binding protein
MYISNGSVDILHKSTISYICDLKKDEYFGEIGFFSTHPRQLTIRSKEYTTCVSISKEEFIEVGYD